MIHYSTESEQPSDGSEIPTATVQFYAQQITTQIYNASLAYAKGLWLQLIVKLTKELKISCTRVTNEL